MLLWLHTRSYNRYIFALNFFRYPEKILCGCYVAKEMAITMNNCNEIRSRHDEFRKQVP